MHDAGKPRGASSSSPRGSIFAMLTTQQYNLLIADLFDRLPLDVIESPAAQQVIQYFHDKLTERKEPS
jgi:hypothetical protein